MDSKINQIGNQSMICFNFKLNDIKSGDRKS